MYLDEVLADNPTAVWKLDEPSGNLVSSNGTYTAVQSGGVTYAQDGVKGGKSVYFDGSDDSLTIGSFPDFMSSGTFTFEVWVKYGSQASDYPTFARRDGNGKAWLVRTRGAATGSRINEIESYDSGQTVMSSPATFSDNMWHHVVMVSNHNSGTLYIDGVAYTSRTGTVSAGGTGSTPLYLGCGASAVEYFQGFLAYPAVYPTALSAARVLAHYNAVTPGPPAAVVTGLAGTLALASLPTPIVSLGAVTEPPMQVVAGRAGVLSLGGMPVDAPMLGAVRVVWFLEAPMPTKRVSISHQTASLEARMDRRRINAELLVRA